MKNWVLDLLSCPHCEGDVALEVAPTSRAEDDILEGILSCPTCARDFPITNGIPRFVERDEDYAENFGFQWQKFRETQIDRLGGHTLSGSRLLSDTRWPADFFKGINF